MATNLRLTDLGRNAILDDENVGTKAVRITKMALGAGSGTGGGDDDGRTTLRDQRDIVAATGSASVAGQIAVRGEFTSANAYAATEMGLFARIGAAGAEFLFAYWTDDGTVFINKPASLRIIVATTIALVRSAAAVEVTLAPEIAVGTVAALLDLTDSPNSYVNAAKKKVVVKEDGTGVEFAAGLLDHEAADDAETRAGALRTKAVTPAGLKAVVDDLLNGAPGALDTLNELADALGDDPNFSVTVMALINARLTQDQVDARIDARSREIVLASDINLAAGARTAQALGASMDGFRWLVIVAGESGSDYSIHARVPRADIVARSAGSEELLGWAANFQSDKVQLYEVNRATGVLTTRGAAQSHTGRIGGADLAWDGVTLFGLRVDATNDTSQLYEVNRATGVLTTRGAAQSLRGVSNPNGVGLIWDGSTLLGWVVDRAASDAQLYEVDRVTGALTARGAAQRLGSGTWSSAGSAWDGATVFVWAVNTNNLAQLYELDRATGELTERGAPQSLGLSNSGGVDLAWDGSTLLGWAFDGDSDTAQLYEVNPITGVLTTRGGERNLGSGTWTGNGLVWVSTVTGQIDVGGIELDRTAAASLGIKSSRALHVHEVIGVP